MFECAWLVYCAGWRRSVCVQRAQSFMALPELSSAELPVRDDETVSDI